MTAKEINMSINKNRDEIQRFLSSALPLDIIKFNINILSARNERLIKRLEK